MASVYKDECMYCYASSEGPEGVNVCLDCFQGFCSAHLPLHHSKRAHSHYVNIRKTLRAADKPAPTALVVEEKPDEFDIATETFELRGSAREPYSDDATVETILKSDSAAHKAEVSSWQEEFHECEHTFMLDQHVAPGFVLGTHCASCELDANLWLCMTCGQISCGRKQYGGGLPGNGHALAHYSETGHAVAVKLGTIEPEGKADIYCYTCDDAVLDPALSTHLTSFGINIADQTKTVKNLTELQLEENLKHDFSMTDTDGNELEPVSGPGYTGMTNLGNSCYMASTLQVLFSLPAFATRYTPGTPHFLECTRENPAECLECQLYKVRDGLLSGAYTAVKPTMIKTVLGAGHSDFATMQQQDAGEYFVHVLSKVEDSEKRAKNVHDREPTNVFKFAMEERLQCTRCSRVRYTTVRDEFLPLAVPVDERSDGTCTPVALESTLRTLTAPIEIAGYACAHCDAPTVATKQTGFKTFPKVLVANASRVKLNNWVPEKRDVPLIFDADLVDLAAFVAQGKAEGEVELESPEGVEGGSGEVFDESTVSSLTAMGFSENRAKRALRATNYGDAETAMQWIFEHMDDADIDAELPPKKKQKTSADPESVAMVVSMGFSEQQAQNALAKTGGSVEAAIEWIFANPDGAEPNTAESGTEEDESGESAPLLGSLDQTMYRLVAFISHKGPSVHSGHYVAHIRHKDGWVLYNDEKVVKAPNAYELIPLAYIYIFERV